MLVTSLNFALMDCYGHGILVKMCYAIVRKCTFGMKLTEFVQDIKNNVFMKGLFITSGCHSNEKAVFVKVHHLQLLLPTTSEYFHFGSQICILLPTLTPPFHVARNIVFLFPQISMYSRNFHTCCT